MRYIIVLIALLFSTNADARISGKRYNQLVDSYNVTWLQHEMLVQKHNELVGKANIVIRERNNFAMFAGMYAQKYFHLREYIYDEFSSGRQRLTLQHPHHLVPPIIGENGFERKAEGAVKADVSKTRPRIDGTEIVRLEKGMAARLKAMAKRYSSMQDALDNWNDSYIAARKAWVDFLMVYAELDLAWRQLHGKPEELNFFRFMCAQVTCHVCGIQLVYGPKVK